MASQLQGKPFLLDHPEKLISEGGVGEQIGTVLSARVDESDQSIIVEYEISGLEHLDAIRQGMKGLSLGYLAATGVDGYQVDSVIDHLAACWAGRGGPTLQTKLDRRPRFDAMEGEVLQVPDPSCTSAQMMHTCLVTEAEQKLQDAAQVVDSIKEKSNMELQTKLDAAVLELDIARRDAELAKTELASIRATIESAKTEVAKAHSDAAEAIETAKTAETARFDAAVASAVADRVETLAKANSVLPAPAEGEDRSKMTSSELKIAAVKHADGKDLGDKPTWVDAWFASVVERAEKKAHKDAVAEIVVKKSIEDVDAALTVAHTDAAAKIAEPEDKELAAKERLRQASSTAYLKQK